MYRSLSSTNVCLVTLVVQLVLLLATASGSAPSFSQDVKTADLKLAPVESEETIQDTSSLSDNKQTSSGKSSRAGRMLNLDFLSGDIGREEKIARDRAQSGERQARQLELPRSKSKKLTISGFIPIVSLDSHKDPKQLLSTHSDDSEVDESEEQASQIGKEQLTSTYGGQTSLGHASFAPAPVSQLDNSNQAETPRANRKMLNLNLAGPRRLVSTLVSPSGPSLLQGPSNQPSDCVCVPFYQCRNGWLVEPGQQQQQQQQVVHSPRSQAEPVNELAGDIYAQLRRTIESQNLEQQVRQQYGLSEARQATNTTSDLLGRSFLKPLTRRSGTSLKCGLMRTCCRVNPARQLSGWSQPPQAPPSQFLSGQLGQSDPTDFQAQLASNLVASQYQQFRPQAQQFELPQTQPQASQQQNQFQQLHQVQQLQQQFQPPSQIAQQPQYNLPNQFQQSLQGSMQAQAQQQQAWSQPQVSRPHGSLMAGRCGQRQALGVSGRVLSGQPGPSGETNADFGEFPAHAAILRRLSPGDSLFVCSAALISSQWLATAAHCVRKLAPGELKVRLGDWDVSKDDEFYPFIESNVREIIIHPEFQPSSLANDLALIRLESTIDSQAAPHVSAACLPAPSDQFVGQRCWLAGWGKDAFGTAGAFQSVMRKVELPVVSRQNCELALRHNTRLGAHFRLHPSAMCAGGERGKDACEGDGGAGLFCQEAGSGLTKLAGLVSWGVGCGQRGVPGVYTDLARVGPWVEGVVMASGEEGAFGPDLASIISERSRNATLEASGLAAPPETATLVPTPMPPPTTAPPSPASAPSDHESR